MNKIDTEVIKFALKQTPHLSDEQIAKDYKVSPADVALLRSPTSKKETLKDYARRYLLEMTEEEKKMFIEKLPAEMVWKMGEGMPATTGTLDLNNTEPIRIDITHQLLKVYGPTSSPEMPQSSESSQLPAGSSE